jgi:hypothetical protein
LLYQHSWTRRVGDLEKELKKNKGNRAFEDKESYQWRQGITQVNKLLGEQIRKVHIADREADIYELFFCGFAANTDLLIRCSHNRQLGSGHALWESVAALPAMGQLELWLPDTKGKKEKVTLSVKYQSVDILRPRANTSAYDSVELSVIEVRQQGKVKKEEDRICWRLLTSIDVKELSDALKCVRWYTYRWLIERFHYVLKQGTKIEALQLKRADSLQKAIVVYSMAAFRIMQLTYQSRDSPQASCEVILSRTQWIVLYMLINKTKTVPQQPPCLQDAVKWIGKLGGHLGRTGDGPPGLKTVWLGYEVLINATNVYEIMNPDNNIKKNKKKNLGKG